MAFIVLVPWSIVLFWLLSNLKDFLEELFLHVHSGTAAATHLKWWVCNSVPFFPQTFAKSVEKKVSLNVMHLTYALESFISLIAFFPLKTSRPQLFKVMYFGRPQHYGSQGFYKSHLSPPDISSCSWISYVDYLPKKSVKLQWLLLKSASLSCYNAKTSKLVLKRFKEYFDKLL